MEILNRPERCLGASHTVGWEQEDEPGLPLQERLKVYRRGNVWVDLRVDHEALGYRTILAVFKVLASVWVAKLHIALC